MELDREGIEKRDFPIGRRGYDPAAVDAHLRALAAEVEELWRALDSRAGESLGSTAGTQVRGILEAAEATAADIERKASEDALRTRAEADGDAQRTRADAIARAQAHMAAVARATAVLTERIESMDGEVSTLVDGLHAGAGRLAQDLATVEASMAELYDAGGSPTGPPPAAPVPVAPTAPPAPAAEHGGDAPGSRDDAELIPAPPPQPSAAPPAASATPPPVASPPAAPATLPFAPPSGEPANGSHEDLEGARLIALNMALNGESRVATDRYLAEHYQLANRQQLLDEVYAAIEG